MTVLRRTGRRRDQAPAPDPGAGPEAEIRDVAARVLALAQADLGGPVQLDAPPEPIYAGWGPQAYRLRTSATRPPWDGALVARAGTAPALTRELRWIRTVRAAGFAAPEPAVDDDGGGVVVFREPPGVNLAERMIADMAALPRLLAEFGRLHVALHALPVPPASQGDDLLGGPEDIAGLDIATSHEDPGLGGSSPGREVDGADQARRVAALVASLVAARPDDVAPVVCHGALNPVHVVVDGDGDDPRPVPVNWTCAGLADPEFDVAATLTGFWSAPLYVDSAVQRRVLRMVRESLASAYLGAYDAAAARPLDRSRLDYWQAFHLCRIAAGIARCARHGTGDPWDSAVHVARPTDAFDEVERGARDLLAGD